MKKLSARFHLILFLTLLIHICSAKTEAKIYSYKLFDGMTIPQPSVVGGGRIIWWTELADWPINRGGKMILSKNPDGTGDARVGDTLQLQISNQFHGQYSYTYDAHRPNCFFEDPPAMPPQDITNYFPNINEPNDTYVRILDWCGKEKYTDTLYLVNITDDPVITPTAIPTGLPTPTPAKPGPKPFLDLPWDYKAKGLNFTAAALKIESFFDHEYPFLSSSIPEPLDVNTTVVTFDNAKRSTEAYSSHDGYDFAKRAGAVLGEPVLAAAEGTATYVDTCPACGNMILIDHGNGYQTRYMHLMKDGLVVSSPDKPVYVSARQPVGRIGFSGYVLPPGYLGAHIHFMIVQDKNSDGNFDDNIPDGVTDPFGWEPETSDPWETYKNTVGGKAITGNKSHYLWMNKLDRDSKIVSTNAEAKISIPGVTVILPSGVTDNDIQTELKAAPYSNKDKTFIALGNAFAISAYNNLNQIVRQFKRAFTVHVDFDKTMLNSIQTGTLGIYSSEDGQNWKLENTAVDLNAASATAEVDHMTYFALLGKRLDIESPKTSVSVQGDHKNNDWYRGEVTVTLHAADNTGGSGIDYTIYAVDGGDKSLYTGPVKINAEGSHTVSFYSVDKAGNIESPQTSDIRIDATPPEVSFLYDQAARAITVKPYKEEAGIIIKRETLSRRLKKITIEDRAGNSTALIVKIPDSHEGSRLELESFRYNSTPAIQSNSIMSVNYRRDRNGTCSEYRQEYYQKNKRVVLEYIAKNNITRVTIKEKGKPSAKTDLKGSHSLQLFTSKGTVNVLY